MNALGIHLILDLKECNRELLNDLPYIRATMIEVAKAAGATIIGESFHQFKPVGVTGVLAIAESHLTIHTWPEYGYAAVDVFTCGESFAPRKVAQLLIDRFQAKDPSITELQRGLLPTLATVTS
ncbi:MAG: adenosylmethionine decarboxylase [Dehalococcoidia bacterium]|nr:adenosylmethionine decarboxylase [Dehalococcoidia bacterium]